MNSLSTLSDSISSGMASASSLITLTRKQSAQVALIHAAAIDGNLSDCVLSVDKGVSAPVTAVALQSRADELAQTYLTTGNPSKMVAGINTLLGMSGAPLMSGKRATLLTYHADVMRFVQFTKTGERKPSVQAAWSHKLDFLRPVYAAINAVNDVVVTPAPMLEAALV